MVGEHRAQLAMYGEGGTATAGQPGGPHVIDEQLATAAVGDRAVPGQMFGQIDNRPAGRRQQAQLPAW
jgi:hypothetical protein